MESNRFELKTESSLESLAVVNSFIAGTTGRLGIDAATTSRIQLAVDEACTNIIKHAYSGQKGIITLTVELAGEDLIITIGDKGKPFNPNSVPHPDLEANLEDRVIGGLGIYFMRKLMDDVSYAFSFEEGNKLTMRKHLPPRNGI